MRLIPTLMLCLVVILGSVLAEKDFYGILGVARDATERQIKKAFRKLSLKYHPDKTRGNAELHQKYLDVSEAYEVLNDPDKRQIYDIDGEEGLKSGGRQQRGNSIFDFFGGAGGGGGRRKGPNFQMKLDVTLEELYNGGERPLKIKRKVLCKSCRGTGAKDGKQTKCKACKGKGVVMKLQQLGPGFNVQMQSNCDRCGGKGNIPKHKCPKCRGRKLYDEETELKVVIEKGMPNGHPVLFERASEQSPDTTPGDVIVNLITQNHHKLRREGNDLHYDQTISLKEALLGYKKVIKQLDGRSVVIKSTNVTPHGFTKFIKGEGMPHHNFPSEKGQLVVHFSVNFPKTLSSEQKETIKKLLPN